MTSENRTTPHPAPLPTVITTLVLHHILLFAFNTIGANSRVLGEWPQRPGLGVWMTEYHHFNWLAPLEARRRMLL